MAHTVTHLEVLGSGCAKCKKLHELTKAAAAELGLQAEVSYSTEIEKIIAMGVMSSPVLAVNGKPVLAGNVPDVSAIKKLLVAHTGQITCCSDKDACDVRCFSRNQTEGGGCSSGSS